ncbi:MAG TPA: aspartate ammonia-lyase [Kiritimatiellia bacterium]|jgi:aspartate ammonia-lyase|nr:aspartate ammonia-lyase [Lentisphaerota bacterium]HRV30249.1 aspartate ammonia-lyase [Kiritimatiellia bacterium]
MTTSADYRLEHDFLGPREIPARALYGAHTSRSLENFPISGTPLPIEIIHGMVLLKLAAARANAKLGLLPSAKAAAIEKACRDILTGAHDTEFPVDIYQAGSGTSSHMNVNEVIANLANQALEGGRNHPAAIHPNDDVNMGQSTNNCFPSGAKIALLRQVALLTDALSALAGALRAKAREFSGILKAGRTHLQDAVPISLGQEFDAYAQAVARAAERLNAAADALRELGSGGNAIGTGINTKPAFRAEIIAALNAEENGSFRVAKDGIYTTQFMTDFAHVSAAIRAAALDVHQIANNLRLLSSGPNTGLGEIRLPPVEPGSSIMPGKINPSICESVNMVCLQVQGLDYAVALACGSGQLELNTHMPLIGANCLQAAKLLAAAARALAGKCVAGITADEAVCRRNLERSAALATLLNPRLGYDRVAALVRESLATGHTLKELALAQKMLTATEYEALLAAAIQPNL